MKEIPSTMILSFMIKLVATRKKRTPSDFRGTNSENCRGTKQKGKISLTFECGIQGYQAENPLARSVSGRREKIRCRSRGNTPVPRSTRTWKLVGSSSNIDDASSDRALEVVISGNGTSCTEPSPTLTRFPDSSFRATLIVIFE